MLGKRHKALHDKPVISPREPVVLPAIGTSFNDFA